jgi:hypothetical protein
VHCRRVEEINELLNLIVSLKISDSILNYRGFFLRTNIFKETTMKLTIAIATMLAAASVATAAGKKAAPAATTPATTTAATTPAMVCMVSGKKAEAKDEAACKAIKGGMWSAEATTSTTTH